MSDMSIYEELMVAGQPINSHYSDLYTPVNDVTKELVKKHKCRATIFINQTDGGWWYDIPFAYEPYWDCKQKKNLLI